MFMNKSAGLVTVNPKDFDEAMSGEYFLLDVRTRGEFSQGHIDGATLIPVNELQSRLGEIENHKEKPVLVYCLSGARSRSAANFLAASGFSNVLNLRGGITAWSAYK